VDYAKSMFELYLEVIKFHHHAKSLDGHSNRETDRKMKLVGFSRLLQQIFDGRVETEVQGQARMIDGLGIREKYINFGVNARGLIEGEIIHLGPSYSDTVSSFEANKAWKNSFWKYYDHPQDLELLREQDEAYTATLLDMDPTDLTRVCSLRDVHAIFEAYHLKQAWDNDDEAGVPFTARKEQCYSEDVLTPGITSNAIYEPRRFLGSNTCMGLVPPEAEVGDFVCRFWGCDVAVILRLYGQRFRIICRADMATGWVKTDRQPCTIRKTHRFEGGGVVIVPLTAHELQKLTC
jgi:hypothetical protein